MNNIEWDSMKKYQIEICKKFENVSYGSDIKYKSRHKKNKEFKNTIKYFY